MFCSDTLDVAVADHAPQAGFRLTDDVTIISTEPTWRWRPDESSAPAPESRVVATRWRALDDAEGEAYAETPEDAHVVGIALRKMNLCFSVAGRTVLDGPAIPGMLHVTAPGAPVRCVFRGSYDSLHLHVPNDLIDECARDLPGDQAARLRAGTLFTRDQMVERLAFALLGADEVGGRLGQLYADCIGVSIISRLLAAGRREATAKRQKESGLVKWRLKRAVDYVEAHIGEPVSLADIAAATGLTRMHFAAQFKLATGLSPHEYLLRRRVERAQQMLVEDGRSVVNVALSVGFQSQSHFTSIFTRFVGQPPRAWRRS